jgi:hypothetical protein
MSGKQTRENSATIARSSSGMLRNGSFLTRDDLTSSYAIIRHNIRTYRSAGVIAVVSGRHNAESELKNFEGAQDSADRHEGWRYFIEKTNLKAGTDPAEATQRRQAELDGRESKALRETQTPNLRGPDPKK